MILGISSRVFSAHLPFFIANNAGDILWAGMLYFVFRGLFISRTLGWALVASLVFSFLIEFSQLYQADWLNSIRSTTLGALVLGKGFLAVDLLRYSFGVALAYFADILIIKHSPDTPHTINS
ncbi:ribosomal maturation YjgA family protein [Pontibacter sp. H249]|uniref:ribosomal maturation YjgA family protein n=1 Tax=Pontibacter sp. H249 TaxID=3133420 RepID=UPI0030BFCF7A